jgi:RNA polymerase sigma-70 factor (ECF subfamily)
MPHEARPAESEIDLETVWRAFRDRLYAYVRRRVPSDHDAEDLVQDVFARIQASARKGTGIENVSGWVYQVTRNALADYYRVQAKHERMADELTKSDEGGTNNSNEAAGWDPGAELSRCLRPFVEQLPDSYAEAVALTDLGGMSQTEAAAQLGLSVSGMKSRVQRGRAKLKDLVLDCCDVELDSRRHVVDVRPRTCPEPDGGCSC